MARFKLPSIRPKATRQVTGTSYSAQGTQPVKNDQLKEIGSASSSVIRDLVPELANRTQARKKYTEMVRGDASVRVSLRAGKAPVLGAEFYFDPFSANEEDMIIKELCEYNLFEGMTIPWLRFLEQALKMMEKGFEPFEPVWELREWSPRATSPTANRKKYTMLRKLAVRPSETVKGFEYDDNGGPVEMIQNAVRKGGKPEEVRIPIEKLCVFTFDQEGGDLEGSSILRSAYPHWYYKNYLYKIDAIQKERHGIGVPDIELQPGYDEADKRIAHELGANLRTNEKSYIVRTTMMKIGFAELSGNLVDPLKSASHHDNMIMKNVMVQFLNAGVSESGARATSATSMDMFLKAMKYVAQIICDAINMYVIPNLVTYNFKTDRFPKLQVRNIGEAKDMQMWAAAMANLKKQGLIQVDDETEQWFRKQTDMPKRITPYQAEEPGGITENITKTNYTGVKNGSKGSDATTGNVGKSPSSGQ